MFTKDNALITPINSEANATLEFLEARPNSRDKAVRQWRFWGIRASQAVLDQGLTAGSNFVISILLARWLLPAEYGSYALAYTFFLILSLAYQAVLLEPQRVFGPSEYLHTQREYLGVLVWIHCGVALAIILGLGVAAEYAHVNGDPNGLPGALSGLAVASPCILLLWLLRGAFYIRMSPQQAAQGTAAYCVAVSIGLVVMYRLNIISPFAAFVLMGIAALAGSVVLWTRLKPLLRRSELTARSRAVLQQHWQYGRWILLSSLLSWCTSDIYFPIVSSASGLASAGTLKALLNFSLPAAQTFSALSVFVLPYATRVHVENGLPALNTFTWRMTGLFAAGSVAYWFCIVIAAKPLMHLIYGNRYAGVESLVPYAAVASLPWTVAYVPAIALRVVRSSASLLGIYCASGAISVLIGIPATRKFGLQGALWTMVLSNWIALLVAFILVRRKLHSSELSTI